MPYKDKEKTKEYNKKYHAEHREEVRIYNREYLIEHREEKREYKKKYWMLHKEEKSKQDKEQHIRDRKDAFDHYGNKCVCCGETEPKFLAIDHINNDGAEHRKTSMAKNIHRWLRKNNYPDGFQILCHNCNIAKGFYGKCPHQERIK